MKKSLIFNPIILILALVIGSYVKCDSIRQPRVLVLLDNFAYRYSHSFFFEDIESQGYTLEFKSVASTNIELKTFGEYNYDQIIFLASGEIDSKTLSRAKLLDFFDSGRNIFFATDVQASKYIRILFSEFGIEIDDLGSRVQDGFNFLSESNDQSLVHSDNLIHEHAVVSQPNIPILYRGVGLTVTKYESYQIFSILKGTESTYSINLSTQTPLSSGNTVTLVAAAQGRNNARAVLCGSIELLSNDFYRHAKFGNRQFARDIISWNFGESGIIRVGQIYHHKIGETAAPFSYKIMDDLEYGIELFEWNQVQSAWVPYVSDKQIMIEFVMLDPYIRLPLKRADNNSANYKILFKVPDKHGIFQFKVNYRRPGYNFISEATKVTVRPFNHNEYDRYLRQAIPYYLSTWGTVVGFLVFIVFFLLDKEKAQKD